MCRFPHLFLGLYQQRKSVYHIADQSLQHHTDMRNIHWQCWYILLSDHKVWWHKLLGAQHTIRKSWGKPVKLLLDYRYLEHTASRLVCGSMVAVCMVPEEAG